MINNCLQQFVPHILNQADWFKLETVCEEQCRNNAKRWLTHWFKTSSKNEHIDSKRHQISVSHAQSFFYSIPKIPQKLNNTIFRVICTAWEQFELESKYFGSNLNWSCCCSLMPWFSSNWGTWIMNSKLEWHS